MSRATLPPLLSRLALAAGLLLLLGAVVWVVDSWVRRPADNSGSVADEGEPPPEDPRVVYKGPFRNGRPDVRYVPDRECAECHDKIAGTYARHPMGQSLTPIEAFASPARESPFEALGRRFRIVRED